MMTVWETDITRIPDDWNNLKERKKYWDWGYLVIPPGRCWLARSGKYISKDLLVVLLEKWKFCLDFPFSTFPGPGSVCGLSRWGGICPSLLLICTNYLPFLFYPHEGILVTYHKTNVFWLILVPLSCLISLLDFPDKFHRLLLLLP